MVETLKRDVDERLDRQGKAEEQVVKKYADQQSDDERHDVS
jgi:hypothetical protein